MNRKVKIAEKKQQEKVMWQIVKAEFRYNWHSYTVLAVFTLLYTMFVLFNFQLISDKNFEIDYWGGFYSFVILFSIFSIWQTRFKEKRERFFSILPISQKQLAFSRFWFAVIPFIILLFYFFAIYLIVINVWNIELSIPLMELGIIFILFAGFIRARDDWFSHWNFIKRIQAAFVSVLIIQIIVVAIFLNPPDEYMKSIPIIVDYAEIIFFLLGLIIMVTTIFSYQKRKSYLS